MRTMIIRAVILLGILFLLLVALTASIRLYPYPYDFSTYPNISHTKSGAAGDPINILFVGRKDQIMQSFHRAGWLIPDPITTRSSMRIAMDSLAHRRYPTAPVSNLYVYGRVQDLAFEKPTTDVQNRGHIRIWKTDEFIGGQPVWVGAATYDSGIELSSTNHLPTHHIIPTVDLERNTVGADLATTDLVRKEAYAALTPPIFFARNGGGDYYESDGNILVISFTQALIPLHQPAWGIEGLKTVIFLFYDALFTAVGTLIAFLVLVVILISGLALWRFAERNRSLKKT